MLRKKAKKKGFKKNKKTIAPSLQELRTWEQFQSLTKLILEKSGYTVEVSGVGPDDGKDLLVSMTVDDKIAKHVQKWVVQCKFYNRAVSLEDINDQNLPSLVYSHNASGYLLVVKRNVTAKLTKHFEKLNAVDEPKLKFKYVVWQEADIINRNIKNLELAKQFLPKYHATVNTIK